MKRGVWLSFLLLAGCGGGGGGGIRVEDPLPIDLEGLYFGNLRHDSGAELGTVSAKVGDDDQVTLWVESNQTVSPDVIRGEITPGVGFGQFEGVATYPDGREVSIIGTVADTTAGATFNMTLSDGTGTLTAAVADYQWQGLADFTYSTGPNDFEGDDITAVTIPVSRTISANYADGESIVGQFTKDGDFTGTYTFALGSRAMQGSIYRLASRDYVQVKAAVEGIGDFYLTIRRD